MISFSLENCGIWICTNQENNEHLATHNSQLTTRLKDRFLPLPRRPLNYFQAYEDIHNYFASFAQS